MYKILDRRELAPETVMFHVEAPRIARKIAPGQFVIVRIDDDGERIPLSYSGCDPERGTIRLIIQGVGYSTRRMIALQVGDAILDVVGPLGARGHLPEGGSCVLIGGGYGTGAILPTALEQKASGRRVIGIVGARSADLVLLEDELREACDETFVTTNDGSAGIKGFVTHALEQVLENEEVGAILAVGPVPMMRAVADMTRSRNIPTIVSLNPIMVDGTGMCGGCRVTIGGKVKFACYDGPDFDGHKVDFDELVARQKLYRPQERKALDHLCHIDRQIAAS